MQLRIAQADAFNAFVEVCGVALCPLDRDSLEWLDWSDCDDDAELCAVAGVAAVEVDEMPVAEAPATAACAFCADGLGVAEFCACASSW